MANCSAPPAVPSEAYNIQYTSTYLYGQNDSIVRSSDQVSASSASGNVFDASILIDM